MDVLSCRGDGLLGLLLRMISEAPEVRVEGGRVSQLVNVCS